MPKRPRLTPDRIVATAMDLLDREGEKGFSMRKLAAAMEVDPMALYHHHPGRAALMHAVMDALLRDCALPARSGDWRRDLHALCSALRQLAHRHPGAFRIYETYEEWVPGEHRLHEAFHATLLEAGFDARTVVRAVRLLLTYTEAFAVDEISGWLDPPDAEERAELARSLAEGSCPAMMRLFDDLIMVYPDAEFEFGLGLLIRGLEAMPR